MDLRTLIETMNSQHHRILALERRVIELETNNRELRQTLLRLTGPSNTVNEKDIWDEMADLQATVEKLVELRTILVQLDLQ